MGGDQGVVGVEGGWVVRSRVVGVKGWLGERVVGSSPC